MGIVFWIIIGAVGWSFISKRIRINSNPNEATPKYNQVMGNQVIGKRRESRRFLAIEKPRVVFSAESKKVLNLLENTSTNVFITGRAGTGKSTLLKYFRATTKKNIAILAPTGVAAVNIQGQTIHSFFKFGPDVTEDKVRAVYKNPEVYKKLDTIIIDEISMVRADLFDCIEKSLRVNGPSPQVPFGGVQIIVIGDLYQLPPVVTNEEKQIFETYYHSPYFFDSNSYQKVKFKVLELTHVYRQSDKDFIEVLDAIRVCSVTDDHLNKINQQFSRNKHNENDFKITLVPTNAMANAINAVKLSQLPGETKKYVGTITGGFNEKNLPTAQELFLKVGSQIMLLNNDPLSRWINGDLAKVLKLNDGNIRVLFEDGTYDDIGFYKWDMIRFIYDEDDKKIKSEVVGSFTQLPVRLAWAVTIHKGQGKTFEKVFIDFGSGTFAPGQAYVALSRCKSLSGLSLKSPLEHRHIFIEPRIGEFLNEAITPKKRRAESSPRPQ